MAVQFSDACLPPSSCRLEEAVLAGVAVANAVRDYQQKVQEINEEKRIMDRELARARVSANHVAVVVASEKNNSRVVEILQADESSDSMLAKSSFALVPTYPTKTLAKLCVNFEARVELASINKKLEIDLCILRLKLV